MKGLIAKAGLLFAFFGLAACTNPRNTRVGLDSSVGIGTDDASGSAGAGGTSGGTGGANPDGGMGGMDGSAEAGGSGGTPVILTPAMLTLDPLSKDLSSIVIGHYAEATFQVSNMGQTATSLPTVTMDGTDAAQFSMTSNACNAAVPGGKNCLITVRFTPTTAGLKSARLNVSATMGGALTAMLQGTGIMPGALAVDQSNLSLGSVLIGQTGSPGTVTVTNTGGAVSGPLSTTISDSTEIAIATDGCKGMTLAANAKCTITVTLKPMTAGPKSATLSVTASPGGTTSASLTGTGLAPALLAVTPATAAFPDTVVGATSAAQSFTITNGGDVAAGMTTALAVVLTVNSGTAAAEFALSSNTCTATLGPRSSCTVGVTFKPSSAAANKGATLTASAAPGGTGSASMTGKGLSAAALALSPTAGGATDFGTIVTNSSASQTFVVTNNGQQASSAVAVSTTGTDFTIVPPIAGDCTGTSPLAPGASCTIQVKFAPTTAGAKTSTLTASATTGGTRTLSLTGTAVPPGALMIAPASQAFGSLLQNTSSAPSTLTVTNTGGAPTSALTTALSGSTDFSITTDGCRARTLAAAGTCTITVTFTPTSGGQKTGTLTVSAATGGTTSSNLIGTGLTPALLTVSPTIFTFPAGTVSGTTSAAQSFTVTNTGGVASGTVGATIGGTDASQFSVASSTCATVAPGATCTIGVAFKPTTAGTKAGTLNVTASPGGSASATLGATALAPAKLTIAPAAGSSNDFGSILVGSTMLQTFVVANSGEQATSTPLTITLTGTDFALATPPATGDCASTTSLAPAASCVVRVQFKPTMAVARTGALSVSAATGGTATLTPALTGTGVNPSAVSITPLSQSFGSVLQGTPSASHTFTVTNTGGVSTAALTTSTGTSTDFAITVDNCKGKVLAMNGTCTITIVMTPQSAGVKNANLTVTDSASATSSTAALTGTGLAQALLTVSPATFTFPAGTAAGNTSAPQTFTITNTGGVVSGTITPTVTGSDFGISSNNCTTLAPASAATCTIGVVFKPATAGSKTGTLNLAASPGGPASATLAGTAVAPASLAINPTSQAFGMVAQGSPSPPQSFTVTNNGGAPTAALTTTTGSTEFVLTVDNCKGKVLAVNGTCTMTIVMTPAGTGARSATLSVSDAGSGSTVSASLSGTGLTPAKLTVSPATFTFPAGTAAGTTSAPQTFTVTNTGGAVSGTITPTVTGADFGISSNNCSTTLGPTLTCTIGVVFKPVTTGSKTGTLNLAATPGGPASATLAGTAVGQAALSITPAPFSYNSVAQGSATPQTFTVTNTGGATTGALTTSTGSTEFVITTDNCNGRTLVTTGTCTLTVTLTPAAPAGSKSATLTVSGTPGGSATSSLSATSFTLAMLSLSPITGAFGNVPFTIPAVPKDLLFTLTNSGTQPATGIRPAVTPGTGFSLPAPTGAECTTATTLNPTTPSCSIRVRFTPPGLVGNLAGTLTVTATTGTAPAPVSLTANAYGVLSVPFPAGTRFAQFYGMDGAGTVIVGTYDNTSTAGGGFHWVIGASTITTIPPAAGDTSSDARAISSNGLVVAGFGGTNFWTWAPGPTTIPVGRGPAVEGLIGVPVAADRTGAVIVGEVLDITGTGRTRMFVWRSALAGGFEPFIGDNATQLVVPSGISDGGRIVGNISALDVNGGVISSTATIWTSSGNTTLAGTPLPSGITTGVNAISGDGTVIVGGTNTPLAIKWTPPPFTTAPQMLPNLPNTNASSALAVNQNGTAIVGFFTTPQNGTAMPIAWTPAATDITAALSGAPNIASFSLQGALAVSADGKMVAGNGVVNGITAPWVARLP